MIALYKDGDTNDVCNYRPISILPILSKIVERHVHEHLFEYLTAHNLIYKHQSGIRKQHSTESALAFMIDTLLFNLDKNRINGMVSVDFKKAFDMVNHTILLSKLKIYRLDKDSLYWFESYLNDRTQLVSFKGNLSTVDSITSGVPQGSILGPLLFFMFINDLPLHTSTQTDIFADDTSLLASSDVSKIEDLNEILCREVSNVNKWAKSNHLPLNGPKQERF